MSQTDARQQDVERLRAAYGALNEGVADAATAALAPDAVWCESAGLPDASTVHGRDAIEAFLADFLESWQEFSQEIEDVVVTDDRVALLIHLRATGKASGATVDARYAHVWTMHDGIGIRVEAFRDRESALVAIGAQAETGGAERPAIEP
jgi:ketosteroid isomerase-like protein